MLHSSKYLLVIINFALMPKTNGIKSIAAFSMLILFFATIVSRDFYHLLGHKDEVTCNALEHDNSSPHFHEVDKCNICDHNFSVGHAVTNCNISSDFFYFITYKLYYTDQYSLIPFFQNPDSRGSPVSA